MSALEDIRIHTTTDTTPTEPGDHDLFAHYITKTDMERAIFDGIPATALCGKTWLPTKDAKRYPVCVECEDLWEQKPEGPQ